MKHFYLLKINFLFQNKKINFIINNPYKFKDYLKAILEANNPTFYENDLIFLHLAYFIGNTVIILGQINTNCFGSKKHLEKMFFSHLI